MVVRPAEDVAAVSDRHPEGTTFWLTPGTHHLADGRYSQVQPKDGNRYVGAPGAILDGRRRNQYAFGGSASGVRVEYLTVQRFGSPGESNGEGVVNHDAGTGWVMSHLTIQRNAGAGVLLGDDNVLESSCLRDNGQYGFSAYAPDGVSNITVRDNEITRNNTDDWERRQPGCGCAGGGKFWDARHVVVAGNYIHDNRGPGIWSDTNNAGHLYSGNYISENDAEGLIYEISYNAAVVGNTFALNGRVAGAANPGFPTGAIYLSEAGSDTRVPTEYGSALEVAHNVFLDNWGGVVVWENADRFAGSPYNTSTGYGTLVNPEASLERCSDPELLRRMPYFSDCRWKSQNVRIHDNRFELTRDRVGNACAPERGCGYNALISNYGSAPDWSPYQGTVVQEDITLTQDNRWFDNTYSGPWRFLVHAQDNDVSWEDWRASPYHQDAGSTLRASASSSLRNGPAPGAVTSDVG